MKKEQQTQNGSKEDTSPVQKWQSWIFEHREGIATGGKIMGIGLMIILDFINNKGNDGVEEATSSVDACNPDHHNEPNPCETNYDVDMLNEKVKQSCNADTVNDDRETVVYDVAGFVRRLPTNRSRSDAKNEQLRMRGLEHLPENVTWVNPHKRTLAHHS
ncbi:MAG: hypothetical protein LKI21_07690 [Bifidobacterium crudilactis]|jgi:hypothetical protein|nr:hypothetical protein [Bifidobacterium crudilactis]